jgi:hypothetical protein
VKLLLSVARATDRDRDPADCVGMCEPAPDRPSPLRRERQQVRWLRGLLREAVLEAFNALPGVADALAAAEDDVTSDRATVPQAAARVLKASGLVTEDVLT